MTAIYYRVNDTTSPNGQFTLEVRSPHDGEPPSDTGYMLIRRERHNEIRFRLIDNTRTPPQDRLPENKDGLIVWEKWQEIEEWDGGQETVVSDEGWSIIRMCGFKPEVIAISPNGLEAIRLIIRKPKEENTEQEEPEPTPRHGNIHDWYAVHLHHTTAGMFWTFNSWRYFFRWNELPYFVWRTTWGQRLLIDLTNATLIGEEEQRHSAISLAMKEEETRWAIALLAELAPHTAMIRRVLSSRDVEEMEKAKEKDYPLEEKVWNLEAAIHLAGVHRAESCIPFLRQLEEIDCPGSSTSSAAMDSDRETHWFRPILHHSLRLLGQEPLGFATYQFVAVDSDDDDDDDMATVTYRRFPMPERIADRKTRANQIRPEMPAEDVLRLLGSPDHIRSHSRKVGEFYRALEDWEYDFCSGGRWSTFRITWEQEKRKGRITRIETVPPDWLETNQRESDILGY